MKGRSAAPAAVAPVVGDDRAAAREDQDERPDPLGPGAAQERGPWHQPVGLRFMVGPRVGEGCILMAPAARNIRLNPDWTFARS